MKVGTVLAIAGGLLGLALVTGRSGNSGAVFDRPGPNPAPEDAAGDWEGYPYRVFSKQDPGFARRYSFEVRVSTTPLTWRTPDWPRFPYASLEAAEEAARAYIERELV